MEVYNRDYVVDSSSVLLYDVIEKEESWVLTNFRGNNGYSTIDGQGDLEYGLSWGNKQAVIDDFTKSRQYMFLVGILGYNKVVKELM